MIRRNVSEGSLIDEFEPTQASSLNDGNNQEFIFSNEEFIKYKRLSTFLYNVCLKEKVINTEYGMIRVFRGSELLYLIYSNFENILSIMDYDLKESVDSSKKIALNLVHENVIQKFQKSKKDKTNLSHYRWPNELEYDMSYDREFNEMAFYHWNISPYRSLSFMQFTGIAIMIAMIGFLVLSLKAKLILYSVIFWGYSLFIYLVIIRFLIYICSPITGYEFIILPNIGSPELGFSQYFHPLYQCMKSEDTIIYFVLRWLLFLSILLLWIISLWKSSSLSDNIFIKPFLSIFEFYRSIIIKKHV